MTDKPPPLAEVSNVIGDEIVRAEIIRANISLWGRADARRLACLERAFKVIEFVRANEKAVAALAKKKGGQL